MRMMTVWLFLPSLAVAQVTSTTAQSVPERILLARSEIVAGRSGALAWPTDRGSLTSLRSLDTSPPLSVPLSVTMRAPGILDLHVPPGTPPGTYAIEITGNDVTGRLFQASTEVTVLPPTVPRAVNNRTPVILLNGFQAICNPLRSDSTIENSKDTFGLLATLLQGDGIPVAFFNNCASSGDPTIEQLAIQLGTFIANLTYTDGTPVTEPVDLVVHSMGGLIARAYLAGLQQNGSLIPPSLRVRKLVLIATPNFGSFQAPAFGVQTSEMVPGSGFLWELATWNQRGDDLRGVDALAIAGDGGFHYSAGTGGTFDDGVVSLTSASLRFARFDERRTRVVRYCHVTPTPITPLGMNCASYQGIAEINSSTHSTWRIIHSFLANTTDWLSIGASLTQNSWLSQYGGLYFALENLAGTQYFHDLTQVKVGNVLLTNGGATNTIYYSDFIQGTGPVQFVSQSQGTVGCGSFSAVPGQYIALTCKYGPIINSVTPRVPNTDAFLVQAGQNVTLNGAGFGQPCSNCSVVAYPQNLVLKIQNWTDQAITVSLPATVTGFIRLAVTASSGADSLSVMVTAASPAGIAVISAVANAFSGSSTIAANTWVIVTGTNLATSQRVWQGSDFVNNTMPISLDGVSVTLNGKNAFVYYISANQLNILTPPDLGTGTVQVQVKNQTGVSSPVTIQAQTTSPAFFTFDGVHVTATHSDGSLLGPTSLYPGLSKPAVPNETVILYANGFGPVSSQVVIGAAGQSGSLPSLPTVKIGGLLANVQFAGLVSPGTFQFNVVIPASAAPGDTALLATYNGASTQAGVTLAVAAGPPAPGVSITEYGTCCSTPLSITTGPDGALWFTEKTPGKIGRITTNGTLTEFDAGDPTWITTGPDGALWFTEPGGDAITRMTTSGVISRFYAPIGSQPYALTVGPDGALWFTETGSGKVGRVTTAGVVTEFPLPPSERQPRGIATGPDGALWIAANHIVRLSVTGSATLYPVTGDPYLITVGPDGALWFTEETARLIGRITTSGAVTEYAPPSSNGGVFYGITSGPDGALWFTEQNGYLGRSTTGGVITEYPTPTSFSAPWGIVSGPDNALWFVEHDARKIGRASLASH